MIGTLILNRYEIIEKIGEGGMGIVYKARCTLLNRLVAIKILKPEFINDDDFLIRFKREAHSAASLSHQNIVSVYDVGLQENINFIVMEYVNGKTLKQIVRDNVKLDSYSVMNIALQMAQALEYAHKNNIIHRDIKPDNILIDEENVVKLTDFGIAKYSDSKTLTSSNKIIGSVHYLSPEQAKGNFVDCRSDIYSLGIVMYEMLTGKVPFDGDNYLSVAMMHIQKAIIPPKEILDGTPENLNSVILKALEKEPIHRFQSAKELIEILTSIKENPNMAFNFQNIHDAKTVIMTEPLSTSDKTISDSTVFLKNEPLAKTEIITMTTGANKASNNLSKINNKKIFLAACFLIVATIVYFLGNYFAKSFSTNAKTDASTIQNTVPETQDNFVVNNKVIVPSLLGKSLDEAKNIISSNGFSLGNITSEYNDTVLKGLVIKQSPSPDTSYDKQGKIDLLISQGPKLTQPAPQSHGNNNGNGKDKAKHKNK